MSLRLVKNLKQLERKRRLAAEINRMVLEHNRQLEEAASRLGRYGMPKFFRTERREFLGLWTALNAPLDELARRKAKLKAERSQRESALKRLERGRGEMRHLSSGIQRNYLLQLRQVERSFTRRLQPQ